MEHWPRQQLSDGSEGWAEDATSCPTLLLAILGPVGGLIWKPDGKLTEDITKCCDGIFLETNILLLTLAIVLEAFQIEKKHVLVVVDVEQNHTTLA
jgi:hypothetical protein